MHEAKHNSIHPGGIVRCDLCPHQCRLEEGEAGKCKVRRVVAGKLITDVYGKLSAVNNDPVEKKPLYHFYPGSGILSVGSVGCNMECSFCQNQDISQCNGINPGNLRSFTPAEIAILAAEDSDKLLAFTYNEPIVFFEFIIDTARESKKRGVECVMVTNGFVMHAPLFDLLPLISAFNVDLKSFNPGFYKTITGGILRPVLKSLETIKKYGCHLEITYLVIPGLNDNPDEFKRMVSYIKENFGRSQVLHISRYFPRYKMTLPPTPLPTMDALTEIARMELDFVYQGNTGNGKGSNTNCPVCGELLVKRYYYSTEIIGMYNNRCRACNAIIEGKYKML